MTNWKNSFETWDAALAGLIEDINSPTLPQRLREAIKLVVPFEHLMIFGYRSRGRPLDLFNVSDTEYRKIVVQAYIAGGYLLDPFYRLFQQDYEPRSYRLSEVIPKNFSKSEYYRSHYAYTGIYDETTFFLDLGDGLTGAVSLTRLKEQGKFTSEDAEVLDVILPTIKSIIRHHWLGSEYPENTSLGARNLASLQDHIQTASQQFGRSVLTDRECEVIGYILSGYSSAAVASHLDISAGTVKIHRKNAYQKLSISSVSELFSLFLTSLSDPQLLNETSSQAVEAGSTK